MRSRLPGPQCPYPSGNGRGHSRPDRNVSQPVSIAGHPCIGYEARHGVTRRSDQPDRPAHIAGPQRQSRGKVKGKTGMAGRETRKLRWAEFLPV